MKKQKTKRAKARSDKSIYYYIALLLIYVGLLTVLFKIISPKELIYSIQGFGITAPLLFILLFIIGGFLHFPNGVFLVASPILFPVPVNILVYMIGILCSSSLSHYIGKLLHNKLHIPRLKEKIAKASVRKYIEKYGYWGIFFLQLIGISFDIPNYVAGYLKMDYKRFVVAVFLSNFLVVTAYSLLYHLAIAQFVPFL